VAGVLLPLSSPSPPQLVILSNVLLERAKQLLQKNCLNLVPNHKVKIMVIKSGSIGILTELKSSASDPSVEHA